MELKVVSNEMGQTPLMSVGDRIIHARKAKDMTQLDLAKRLGVSRAAVGQWEINSTSPSIAKLEEVATILNVEPQWLAYNVKPGETRVVYRSPERDNIQWVSELKFGNEEGELIEGDKWGIPNEYLTRDLGSSANDSAICSVNSHSVEPAFEYGDKVIIDRADTKPSPGGTFVYWDGIGYAFARMQAIPGKTPKVRLSQNGADTIDMDLSDLTIVGRVKGRLQRG
ncbi:transcriptional regulator [Ruegeria phage RpAliso]|nr:transcriptional regulator [Ruegeria phage RpAliso]